MRTGGRPIPLQFGTALPRAGHDRGCKNYRANVRGGERLAEKIPLSRTGVFARWGGVRIGAAVLIINGHDSKARRQSIRPATVIPVLIDPLRYGYWGRMQEMLS